MQTAAKTSRFLIDLSSERGFADWESAIGNGSLLQHFVVSRLAHSTNSRQLFSELAQILIRLAEHAYGLRDMRKVQEASLVLMNLPLAGAQQIGLFYQALSLKRAGQIEKAQSLFEAIADGGPSAYRARAIQALGALHYDRGEPSEALRFHLEAARAVSDDSGNLLVRLMVQLEISHIRADIGDHRGAFANLESISPLVGLVAKQCPFYFFFYHNALAVELGELGRIAEAEAACAITLASPFAAVHTNWAETRDEIAAKRVSATPSVVAFNRAPDLAPSPQAEPEHKPKPVGRLAFSWTACKKTFLQRASTAIAVAAAISDNGTTQSILDRVLICIGPRAPPATA